MYHSLNEKFEHTPGWLNYIRFSDKAFFHLNVAANNHNNVLWTEAKREEPQRSKGHCTCGVQCKERSVEPYWLEENGRSLIIDTKRYIATLDQFHGYLTQKLTQK